MNKLLAGLLVLVFSAISVEANETTKKYAEAYIKQINDNMPPNSNAGNIAKLYAIDATMTHGFDQHEANGRDEIQALYENLAKHYKYKRHEIVKMTTEGNRAVIEAKNIDKSKDGIFERKNPIIFSIEFDENGLVRKQSVFIVRQWG